MAAVNYTGPTALAHHLHGFPHVAWDFRHVEVTPDGYRQSQRCGEGMEVKGGWRAAENGMVDLGACLC